MPVPMCVIVGQWPSTLNGRHAPFMLWALRLSNRSHSSSNCSIIAVWPGRPNRRSKSSRVAAKSPHLAYETSLRTISSMSASVTAFIITA
jgi:hypothetical protein